MIIIIEEFTIESFKKFCESGVLMAVKCGNCGKSFLPPKMFCTYCNSRNLFWIEIPRIGKVISYTEIHAPLKNFERFKPYIIVLVEFEGGIRLLGIIVGVKLNDLKIGVNVKLEFSKDYPSGYYFTLL